MRRKHNNRRMSTTICQPCDRLPVAQSAFQAKRNKGHEEWNKGIALYEIRHSCV